MVIVCQAIHAQVMAHPLDGLFLIATACRDHMGHYLKREKEQFAALHCFSSQFVLVAQVEHNALLQGQHIEKGILKTLQLQGGVLRSELLLLNRQILPLQHQFVTFNDDGYDDTRKSESRYERIYRTKTVTQQCLGVLTG